MKTQFTVLCDSGKKLTEGRHAIHPLRLGGSDASTSAPSLQTDRERRTSIQTGNLVSTLNFIAKVRQDSLVLVDTCFVMEDSFPEFAKELIAEADESLSLSVLPHVVTELKRHIKSTGQKSAIAKRGVKSLKELIAAGKAKTSKTKQESDEIADNAILTTAQSAKMKRDVHVLTNDVNLMIDLTNQEGQKSVKSRHRVVVWKLHGRHGTIVRFRPHEDDQPIARQGSDKTAKPAKTPKVKKVYVDYSGIGQAVSAVCMLIAFILILGFVWWKNPFGLMPIAEDHPQEDEVAAEDEDFLRGVFPQGEFGEEEKSPEEEAREEVSRWTPMELVAAVNAASNTTQKQFLETELERRINDESMYIRNQVRDGLEDCDLKTKLVEEDRQLALKYEQDANRYEFLKVETRRLLNELMPPLDPDSELDRSPVLFIKNMRFMTAGRVFDLATYTEEEKKLLTSADVLKRSNNPALIPASHLEKLLAAESFPPRERNKELRRIFLDGFYLITGTCGKSYDDARSYSQFRAFKAYAGLDEESPCDPHDLYRILRALELDVINARRAIFARMLFDKTNAEYFNVDLSLVNYPEAAKKGEEEFNASIARFTRLFLQLERLYNADLEGTYFDQSSHDEQRQLEQNLKLAELIAPRMYSWDYETHMETIGLNAELKEFEELYSVELDEAMNRHDEVIDSIIGKAFIHNFTPSLAESLFQPNLLVSRQARRAAFAYLLREKENPYVEQLDLNTSRFDFGATGISDDQIRERAQHLKGLFAFCEETYARVRRNGWDAVERFYRNPVGEMTRLQILAIREKAQPYLELGQELDLF